MQDIHLRAIPPGYELYLNVKNFTNPIPNRNLKLMS